MAKKLPTPSPEQATKVITTIVTKSLDAALATAKAVGKPLGLSADEINNAVINTANEWCDARS